MCILLWTTSCSGEGIPLILLSNRDEFLSRPTQTAGPWDSQKGIIYSGRDLARPEHGTWLGVNQRGRLAALTNVREPTSSAAAGLLSRGAVVASFLTSFDTTFNTWTDSFRNDSHLGPGPNPDQVGGFSMLCSQFSRMDSRVQLKNLAVVSNRSIDSGEAAEERAITLDPKASKTYGLSNSPFNDPWPKVSQGICLLNDLVEKILLGDSTEQDIIDGGLNILSKDSISVDMARVDLESKIKLLPKSIFIPSFDTHNFSKLNPGVTEDTGTPSQLPFKEKSNLYGTQKQTVVVFYDSGKVRYVERSFFNVEGESVSPESNIVDITFDLEI